MMTGDKTEKEHSSDWIDSLNRKSQEFRARKLEPLFKFLDRIGIKPNDISNSRLVLAVLAFLIFPAEPLGASLIFLVAILLDALDGSLARFQGSASDRGKFIDISVDHIIYIAIIFSLIRGGYEAFPLAYNIFIVGSVYLLATIFKNELEKSDWIIKPYPKVSYLKAIVVIPFFLLMFFSVDFMQSAVLLCNILATILSVYYFISLQTRWNKTKTRKND